MSGSKHYIWMDARGVYFPDNTGPNDGQYVYDVTYPVTDKTVKMPSTGWRYPEAAMRERIVDGRVHFGPDETTVPNHKTYLANTEYQSLTSIRYVEGALSECFADDISAAVVTEIAERHPLRAVFLDAGFASDAARSTPSRFSARCHPRQR